MTKLKEKKVVQPPFFLIVDLSLFAQISEIIKFCYFTLDSLIFLFLYFCLNPKSSLEEKGHLVQR